MNELRKGPYSYKFNGWAFWKPVSTILFEDTPVGTFLYMGRDVADEFAGLLNVAYNLGQMQGVADTKFQQEIDQESAERTAAQRGGE